MPNHITISKIRNMLEPFVNQVDSKMFFKTGEGEYSAHDKFIGISAPTLRKISKDLVDINTFALCDLLKSGVNEERLLALRILVLRYEKGNAESKQEVYNFYMENLKYVNNWNLVDSSAHLILGPHIANSDKTVLQKLAVSKNLWERRIAMVATLHFIKNGDNTWAFKIATALLNDTHDLIHKATGWMLREAGKKNELELKAFLDKHAAAMPRTMLRYSIERLDANTRKLYMEKRNSD